MENLINKVKSALAPYLKNNYTLIVGVSGGPDSVCLLDILSELNLNLVVAHLNHSLRGKESDSDQKFVKELAKKYNATFETRKVNINHQKGNIEENRPLC